MARMRSVKPELWDDAYLAKHTSRDARLLYIALWNHSDEWARCHGDARWIKGHCLPYDDDLNLTLIDSLISELESAKRVQKYVVEGVPYLFLPKLAKHQRLEPNKVPSRLPSPESVTQTQPEGFGLDEVAQGLDEVAQRTDLSRPICAKHVAGGMEHVAGGRTAESAPTANERVEQVFHAWRDAAMAAGVSTYGRSASIKAQARALLRTEVEFTALVTAAVNAGSGGFDDLAKQLTIDSRPARRTSSDNASILARASQRLSGNSLGQASNGASRPATALTALPGHSGKENAG